MNILWHFWIRFFEAFQKAQGAPKVEGYAQGAASSRPAGSPSRNPCILSELSYHLVKRDVYEIEWVSYESCVYLWMYPTCRCVSRGFLSPVSSLRRMMISQLGAQNARFSWHFVRFFVHFIHPSVRVHSSPNQSEHFLFQTFLAHSISFIFSILLIFLFNCWWVDFCVLFGLIFPIFWSFLLLFLALRMLTMTKALWKHPECCTRATMPTRHRSTIHEMWRAFSH